MRRKLKIPKEEMSFTVFLVVSLTWMLACWLAVDYSKEATMENIANQCKQGKYIRLNNEGFYCGRQ